MMTTGSRTNSTDSDYELMQQQHPPPPPHQPDGRLRRGTSNSIRAPHDPPQYQAPRPPRSSRISPNRWRHLHRLSPGRNRNYAGLKDLNRRTEGGEYAVPRGNRDTDGRRYDGFFQGSIAEEGEGEEEEAEKSIGDMTIMSKTTEPCCRHCKCILLSLFLVLLLLTSLGGLGLALYNKFTRDGSSYMQEMGVVDTCVPTWCELTVTRAAHAYNCALYNNSSRECTTEPLSTNIPVSLCDNVHAVYTKRL